MDEHTNVKESMQNSGTKTHRSKEDEVVESQSARPSQAAQIEQLMNLKEEIDMEDTPNVLVTDNSAATTDFKKHVTKTNNQTN